MKVSITCGMQHAHLIQLLNNYKENEISLFQYENSIGLNINFITTRNNEEDTLFLVKKILKNDPIGKVLLYKIEICK